uniref:Uncharacterized protein n=1 Tax=Arundo donax TaxID=35708 RepID=A0A0A9CDF3_ARUDO
MCFFHDWKFYANRYNPTDFLVHCFNKHQKMIGLECSKSDCRVRVSTDHERILHTHFCHELPSGWWERGEYKLRLEEYYKQRS